MPLRLPRGSWAVSADRLATPAMWGQPRAPAERAAVLARAVGAGAALVSAPGPFGPGADLLRLALELLPPGPPVPAVAVRMTGADPTATDLAAVTRRMGRRPDAVVVGPASFLSAQSWRRAGLTGAVVVDLGAAPALPSEGCDGVLGPPSQPDQVVLRWCEDRGIPYLHPVRPGAAPAAGRVVVGLLSPTSAADVARHAAATATPPAAGPG